MINSRHELEAEGIQLHAAADVEHVPRNFIQFTKYVQLFAGSDLVQIDHSAIRCL